MRSAVLCSIAALAALPVAAQTSAQPSPSQQRVIVTNTIPAAKPVATPTPKPLATPLIVKSAPATAPGTVAQPSMASNLNYKGLSFSQLKSKLAEARRYLTMRPLTIASSEATTIVPTSVVRIAFYDNRTRQIDSYVIPKEQFLVHGLSTFVISSAGKQLVSKTIRGNGVNTPVVITDQSGTEHLPLMVQYPRETRGVLQEMAYYVSSHPQMITPEVVTAGRLYVRNVIDLAREQLKLKGYFIQPRVADNAERLATVEHVDHLRFRTEFHPNIYNDIFALYAMNEGNTYRYSVSSAGAGGMVQMIPSTYRMVRNLYPNAGLIPDFVEGMRNHTNAAQAMLLYMQMTWNDLIRNPTVANAVLTKIATQEQLMAAGYNSNPAKLPGYINRGGAGWTSLIPRETQIYLQIWDSLERHVALSPRRE
jgi:hypothetical protein